MPSRTLAPLPWGMGTSLAAEKDLIELIVRTDCHHPYPWLFAAIRTLVAIIHTLPLSVPLLPLSVPLLPLPVPLLRPPQTLRNAAVVWHASLPQRLQQKAFRRALPTRTNLKPSRPALCVPTRAHTRAHVHLRLHARLRGQLRPSAGRTIKQ